MNPDWKWADDIEQKPSTASTQIAGLTREDIAKAILHAKSNHSATDDEILGIIAGFPTLMSNKYRDSLPTKEVLLDELKDALDNISNARSAAQNGR